MTNYYTRVKIIDYYVFTHFKQNLILVFFSEIVLPLLVSYLIPLVFDVTDNTAFTEH